MTGYVANIESLVAKNTFFRHVVYTGNFTQLVLMTLKPKEDIGMEVHEKTDQFFRVETGEGQVVMNGERHDFKDGDVIIVPAGTQHNIINTSASEPLKLYTLYSPPHHPDGTILENKP